MVRSMYFKMMKYKDSSDMDKQNKTNKYINDNYILIVIL